METTAYETFLGAFITASELADQLTRFQIDQIIKLQDEINKLQDEILKFQAPIVGTRSSAIAAQMLLDVKLEMLHTLTKLRDEANLTRLIEELIVLFDNFSKEVDAASALVATAETRLVEDNNNLRQKKLMHTVNDVTNPTELGKARDAACKVEIEHLANKVLASSTEVIRCTTAYEQLEKHFTTSSKLLKELQLKKL